MEVPSKAFSFKGEGPRARALSTSPRDKGPWDKGTVSLAGTSGEAGSVYFMPGDTSVYFMPGYF